MASHHITLPELSRRFEWKFGRSDISSRNGREISRSFLGNWPRIRLYRHNPNGVEPTMECIL
eukprot:969518-Amorphochlora_amoeboformis.AAC.1